MQRIEKLDNGLRIVTKNLLNTNSVTVLILVGAGSRYETKEINGISHFLEHMFFKGAVKYKSTREVSEAIDGVGGDFNAFTGKEYAGYYVKLAADKVNLALDVLADMLINSKFEPEEIEKERGVILEEYNMYQDTPMYQIGWDFERLIYGDQPMGWDQVGTKELIQSVTQEQFIDYNSKLYTPDNTVIVIAGNVDHEAVVARAAELFKFKNLKKRIDFAPLTGLSRERRVSLKEKRTEQAHVVVGFPAYCDLHPKYYAMKILAVILGGNMSSRMFLNVREAKGLAYYISTLVDEYVDSGTLTTSAGVSVDRIDEAIESIIEQYFKVLDREVISEAEVKKARDYIKGKMVLKLEDSEEYAHMIGKYQLLFGVSKDLEEIYAALDLVTVEQVMDAARELFKPEELRLAVIGPYSEVSRFEKLIGL